MVKEAQSVNELFGVSSSREEKESILSSYRARREECSDDDYSCKDKEVFDSRGVIGDGIIDTPEELMDREVNVSFIKWNFWDLWLQKVFRNFASMKFQLLVLLYIPVIWGMFNFKPGTKEPWITAAIGLGFLGGGYVTLATSRFLSRTSLIEKTDAVAGKKKFDTEQ